MSSHKCNWPRCSEQAISNAHWACKQHNDLLPDEFKAELDEAYRQGQKTDSHPTRQYQVRSIMVKSWAYGVEFALKGMRQEGAGGCRDMFQVDL